MAAINWVLEKPRQSSGFVPKKLEELSSLLAGILNEMEPEGDEPQEGTPDKEPTLMLGREAVKYYNKISPSAAGTSQTGDEGAMLDSYNQLSNAELRFERCAKAALLQYNDYKARKPPPETHQAKEDKQKGPGPGAGCKK